MTEISAIIITYNEERNIGRCIDSLTGIADEIIVVDSYSTDRTKEICLQKNVNFYENPFIDYSSQKNYANSLAKYQHIFSIDADETVSDELKRSITKIKNNCKFDGYYLSRLTNYCGRWIYHGGWYPDIKLRLFDKSKVKWNNSTIHEELIIEQDFKSARIKGNLLHYSYYSISDHLNQINKFTEIAANALFDKGKKANFVKLYISPIIKFKKDYIFKLGFLDGYSGFVICLLSAVATFVKYAKLRQLYKNNKK